jgi:uncharacterized protein (TIGR02246 family)
MPIGKDMAWLEQLHHDFVEAFRSNDLKAVGAFYTDDALLLPPGHPMVRGRDPIIAFWEGSARVLDLVFEPTELKMLGEAAFREAGNLLVVRRGTGRETRNMAAKYVSLWLKVDGAWKLESSIWNGAERRKKAAGGGRKRGAGRRGGQGGGGGAAGRRQGGGGQGGGGGGGGGGPAGRRKAGGGQAGGGEGGRGPKARQQGRNPRGSVD